MGKRSQDGARVGGFLGDLGLRAPEKTAGRNRLRTGDQKVEMGQPCSPYILLGRGERKWEGEKQDLRPSEGFSSSLFTTYGRDPGNCKQELPGKAVTMAQYLPIPCLVLPPDPSPNSTLSQVSIEMQNPVIRILMV